MEYLRFCSRSALSLIDVFRILGANILSDRSIDDLLCRKTRAHRKRLLSLDLQLDLGF